MKFCSPADVGATNETSTRVQLRSIAAGILDRIVLRAHRIEPRGESMLKNHSAAGNAAKALDD